MTPVRSAVLCCAVHVEGEEHGSTLHSHTPISHIRHTYVTCSHLTHVTCLCHTNITPHMSPHVSHLWVSRCAQHQCGELCYCSAGLSNEGEEPRPGQNRLQVILVTRQHLQGGEGGQTAQQQQQERVCGPAGVCSALCVAVTVP